MKNIACMKDELERLGVKAELLEDVSIVALYDTELEEAICYATAIDNEKKLYVYIPCKARCIHEFDDRLSIDTLTTEVQASTKKNVKKLASEYARARKTYMQTREDCESVLNQFNETIKDYSEHESAFKVKSFAYGLKKELDNIVRQAYNINKLGEQYYG